MKFIVKLFPEIMIKSTSVRQRFIKILTSNIRTILKRHFSDIAVVMQWDYIEVRTKVSANDQRVANMLTLIPGIQHIHVVEDVAFADLHDIFVQTLAHYHSVIQNKTFCVRVKRRGEHPFTSIDVERYVGGGLNQAVPSAKVKLTQPEVVINLNIEKDRVLLIKNRFDGLGGFPTGTQSDVISLISGGYDSGVSSYMLMRRGCRVHYCFFNLGGKAHEISVKQMAYALWSRYGSSHKVRFIAVDFTEVVGEIIDKIEDSQMGVVLKRMMVRAASHIAERYQVEAIVTGEALGQVSSQTLANLKLIDEASNALVLRPLIAYDKETIIKLARDIGTENIAKSTPEFCGVISKKPTIKAIKQRIITDEKQFDFSLLDKAINNAEIYDIRNIAESTKNGIEPIATVSICSKNDIIVDIRGPDEQDANPLVVSDTTIKSIPFYKLEREFNDLDQKKNYLLYCDQGIMSQLHASVLSEKGFGNVKIFRKPPSVHR